MRRQRNLDRQLRDVRQAAEAALTDEQITALLKRDEARHE
jgi:hypothetical protein